MNSYVNDELLSIYEERVKYRAKHGASDAYAKTNGILTSHVEEYADMVKDYKQCIKDFNGICREIKKAKRHREFKDALDKCDKADKLIDDAIGTVKKIDDTGTMGIILGYTEVSIKVLMPIIVGIITVSVIDKLESEGKVTDVDKLENDTTRGVARKAVVASIPSLIQAAQALKAAKKYKVTSASSDKLLDIRRGAVLQALDRLKRQIHEIRGDVKKSEDKFMKYVIKQHNKSHNDVKTESALSQYDKIVDTILEEFNDGNINSTTCIALMEKASERYHVD